MKRPHQELPTSASLTLSEALIAEYRRRRVFRGASAADPELPQQAGVHVLPVSTLHALVADAEAQLEHGTEPLDRDTRRAYRALIVQIERVLDGHRAVKGLLAA